MKICIYSEKIYEKHNIGWSREGFNIQYNKNNYLQGLVNNKTYYTLSF